MITTHSGHNAQWLLFFEKILGQLSKEDLISAVENNNAFAYFWSEMSRIAVRGSFSSKLQNQTILDSFPALLII